MRKQHPAAEWGERPREKVTVMPWAARKRGARRLSQIRYAPGRLVIAIPEAEMRGAAHGLLWAVRFCFVHNA